MSVPLSLTSVPAMSVPLSLTSVPLPDYVCAFEPDLCVREVLSRCGSLVWPESFVGSLGYS